jgi:hypothetical protein
VKDQTTECGMRYVGGWNGHAPVSRFACDVCGASGVHDTHPGCKRPALSPDTRNYIASLVAERDKLRQALTAVWQASNESYVRRTAREALEPR